MLTKRNRRPGLAVPSQGHDQRGITSAVSFRVVWARIGTVTGAAAFPSRPSGGTGSGGTHSDFDAVVCTGGSGSVTGPVRTPGLRSNVCPAVVARNGARSYFRSPAAIRARLFGAGGRFRSPIRWVGSVKSIASDAGSTCGSTTAFWQPTCGHRYTY